MCLCVLAFVRLCECMCVCVHPCAFVCVFVCVCLVRPALTALVEGVEAGDVVAAHLRGLPEGDVGVRDWHHGRLVVLREGIPGESHLLDSLYWRVTPVRHTVLEGHTS